MSAGEFDRRITLQRKTEADDGYSTSTSGWTDIAGVWAKFIQLPGAERLAASETGAFRRCRYKIRNDSLWSDLNETDRIIDENGLTHDLAGVTSEGRRFFLLDTVYRGDGGV